MNEWIKKWINKKERRKNMYKWRMTKKNESQKEKNKEWKFEETRNEK